MPRFAASRWSGVEEEFVDAWTVQAGHQIPSSSKAPASATAHSREEGKEMDLQGITRWHRRTPPAAKPPRPEDVMPHADAHGRTNREQKHKRPTKPPSALHADGDSPAGLRLMEVSGRAAGAGGPCLAPDGRAVRRQGAPPTGVKWRRRDALRRRRDNRQDALRRSRESRREALRLRERERGGRCHRRWMSTLLAVGAAS